MLIAGHALLVRVVLVEAQRRLSAVRAVVARISNISVVPATADAAQRLGARADGPVEHGLGISQVLGARLRLGPGFAGLLGVQTLPLGHGEHGAAVRAAHLVRHVALLEAVAVERPNARSAQVSRPDGVTRCIQVSLYKLSKTRAASTAKCQGPSADAGKEVALGPIVSSRRACIAGGRSV